MGLTEGRLPVAGSSVETCMNSSPSFEDIIVHSRNSTWRHFPWTLELKTGSGGALLG